MSECLCKGFYRHPLCPEHGHKARKAEPKRPPINKPKPKGLVERVERTKNLTPSHKRAPKMERELAKRVGGKLTAASGARDVKGDVRVQKVMRLEAKTTKHGSFSVTLDMIQKLELNAALADELPVIIVEFITPDGRPLKQVAVCPTYVIDQLTGK